ncbi:MAG: hypothetical protein KBC66_10870 [Kiritimatiellae bacterium]|nr:hypothetical protein [Kiritimatiellia bacterium]NLD90938.1 hypothetical protein [Lentisphaerota bacterium]HPC19202.1 hypothetical protein [Kiritimatiellia bacterium]
MPAPRAELAVDDWINLSRSKTYASYAEAAWQGLLDPNRPLSMIAVNVGWRLFGDRALYWTLVSLIGNSLLLLFTMKMALELTGRRIVAILTGVVFTILPNLTETYHWSTQVLNEVSCGLVPYALSGWLWVAYVRRGGGWRLALSALAFGVGLFSYEAGIFLPAAYVVLLPWRRRPFTSIFQIMPVGAACVLYLAWRGTNAFGLIEGSYYPPHMQAGVSLMGIVMNAWHLMHWWLGDYMFGAMRNGFDSFATLPLWTRRFLFVANAGVVLLVGRGLHKLAGAPSCGSDSNPFRLLQIAGFGLAWTAAAMALSLVSYTAGRLNVIPAMGVSLLTAVALDRWPFRKWGPTLVVLAFLAIVANQGTAESWRQSGEFQRRLLAHIKSTRDQWEGKPIMLIDTRSLRQRLTPGLLRGIGADPATWTYYGNALLMRGYVPLGMARLLTGQVDPGFVTVHDVECGARIEGDQLHWHDRYLPSKPRSTAMENVLVVDVLAVGQAGK